MKSKAAPEKAERLCDGLPLRQRVFVRKYLDGGNATQAYFEAGYRPRDASVASAAASRLLRSVKVSKAISALLKAHDLTPEHAGLRLFEALHATKTVFFAHQGRVVNEREVVDWGTRAEALDMLHKILGLYKSALPEPSGRLLGLVIYLPSRDGIRLPTVVGGESVPA